MQVQVDFKLFQMLVECIEKQATIEQQDAETQARWKAIINETYVAASKAALDFKAKNMLIDGRKETGMGPIIRTDSPYV